jgi:uncharacterized lipoprotein YajG
MVHPFDNMSVALVQDLLPRRKILQMSTAVVGSVLLSACGGANESPEVTLAVVPTSASTGASVTLVAVAIDDRDEIKEVQFYRNDATGATLLATIRAVPYQFQTSVPGDAVGEVSFFARAVDSDDQQGDSNLAVVAVPS